MKQSGTNRKPRLGCAALVEKSTEMLLGKRKKKPNRGKWVLPGGGVNFGESLKKTIQRELLEEAGIRVRFNGVAAVRELIKLPDEHRVIVFVYATHVSGKPVAASDLSEVRYFTPAEIRKLRDDGQLSSLAEKVLEEEKFL